MTKYQELKKQLREEAEKVTAEFNKTAKAGDFVKVGNQYGVLIVIDPQGTLAVAPISLNMAVIRLSTEQIPEVEVYGNAFGEVAKAIKDQALVASKNNEEVPF